MKKFRQFTRKKLKEGGGGCIGRKCSKNKVREAQEKQRMEEWTAQRKKNKQGLLELKEFYLNRLQQLGEKEESGLNRTELILDIQDRVNQIQLLLDLFKEQETPRVIIGRTGKTKTRRVR